MSAKGSPAATTTAAMLPADYRPTLEVLDEDKIRAIHLADQWSGSYQAGATMNTARTHDDWDACYWGILAEAVIARATGTPVDGETYQHGDNGYDLVIDGETVDIKLIVADLDSPDSPDPKLLVEAGEVHADRYILASYEPGRPDWGEPDRIELLGECDAETVREHEPERWPRDIENHVVPLEDLRAPRQGLGNS